jgi:hypothetical protein
MAQNTAGITLKYGEATIGTGGAITWPLTWTTIPDVVSVPAMGAAPAKLDATTLAETKQKVYIDGLMDLGGSLEFEANMTPELLAVTDVCTGAPATGKVWAFAVEFPAPLSQRYKWIGQMSPVLPGEAGVDAVVRTKLYISQETEIVAEDIA